MSKSPKKQLPPHVINFGPLLHCHENTILLDYHQPVLFMPVILEGAVKVCKLSKNDDDVFLYYLTDQEACILCYTLWLNQSKSSIRIVSESAVKYVLVPCYKIEKLMAEDVVWTSFMISNFSSKCLEIAANVEMITGSTLNERLYTFLAFKSRLLKKNILTVSHQQLANDLRTSRVVISRLLKHLELKGKLVLRRNEIHMR